MPAKGRAAGLEVRCISHHGFIESIYLCDPNGYVVELCAKGPVHDAAMNPTLNGAWEKLQRWQARRTAEPELQSFDDGPD